MHAHHADITDRMYVCARRADTFAVNSYVSLRSHYGRCAAFHYIGHLAPVNGLTGNLSAAMRASICGPYVHMCIRAIQYGRASRRPMRPIALRIRMRMHIGGASTFYDGCYTQIDCITAANPLKGFDPLTMHVAGAVFADIIAVITAAQCETYTILYGDRNKSGAVRSCASRCVCMCVCET